MLLIADPRVAAVEVRECGEPLVDVRTCGVLHVDHRYGDAEGAWTQLRRGVARRLVAAAARLPDELRLLLVEGYRPPAVQARYFSEHLDDLRAAHPGWTQQRLRTEASKHTAPPEVGPHPCGAAVDVTLCTGDGEELELGTRVNATPEESDEACFTDASNISPVARRHRRVLSTALAAEGLVNYPPEWWHWSFGDRYWAYTTGGGVARYGPTEPS